MTNEQINISKEELAAYIGTFVGNLIMENFLLRQQLNQLAYALNQQVQQAQENGQEPKEEKKTKEPVKNSG